MVGIKLEQGVGWKNIGKLMIWSMYFMKWKKTKHYLDLECSVMLGKILEN